MRDWLKYVKRAEPARLRSVWVALVALLGSVGVSVSPAVDAKVGVGLGVAAAALSLLQGEWTRDGVFSPKAVDQLKAQLAALQRGDLVDVVAALPADSQMARDLLAELKRRVEADPYMAGPPAAAPPVVSSGTITSSSFTPGTVPGPEDDGV